MSKDQTTMRVSKPNLRVINSHSDIGESYDQALGRLLELVRLLEHEHGSVEAAREALLDEQEHESEATEISA